MSARLLAIPKGSPSINSPVHQHGARPAVIDANWICNRYESARCRLPAASFPSDSRHARRLVDVSDEFDVFLLDAYGVLNVGGTAIPGAPEAVKALSDVGKDVMVLTNGATIPAADALAKYRDWGYNFTPAQMVASRDQLAGALAQYPADWTWGFWRRNAHTSKSFLFEPCAWRKTMRPSMRWMRLCS